MYLRQRDLDAAMRLWNELAEFPASQVDAALKYCLEDLAARLGATQAFWIASIRDRTARPNDALRGWRPCGVVNLNDSSEASAKNVEVLQHFRAGEIDPQTRAIAASAGATRAYLRRELVDDGIWKSSWLYNDVLRPQGVGDRIVGAVPVGPNAESILAFDRPSCSRPFGARERDILQVFLQGARAFHRDILRSYGPVGYPPISPRERDVLRLLLTHKSQREIARELGLTARTAHWYVQLLVRKFGVHGRTGLMALWLRDGSGD